MAIYLVNGDDLEDVADAIRTKGDTSAALSFPDGFIDAIDAIDTGGGGGGGGTENLISYATRLNNLFMEVTNLPQKLTIDLLKLDSGANNSDFLYRAYESGKNTATIDVELNFRQTTGFKLNSLFEQAYGVKTVKITGNLQYCTDFSYMFSYCSGITSIDAVFDLSSVTSDAGGIIGGSGTNSNVTTLSFTPNTASYNVNIKMFSALNDASIVQAANCLVAGVSGKTLTLHDTPKARCQTLMGTNDNGTFVADANGTLSLADFITTVKGWTLG